MTHHNYKKKHLFKKAVKLFKADKSQKEIAKQLGVTEKTIGVWLKEVKELNEVNLSLIKQLQNQLQHKLQNGCTTQEINDLTQSMQRLENRWFNK